MNYEVDIYFAGPQGRWSEKPSEMERIGTLHARWLWLARLRAQSVYTWANAGRCLVEIHSVDGDERTFVERWREPSPILRAADL